MVKAKYATMHISGAATLNQSGSTFIGSIFNESQGEIGGAVFYDTDGKATMINCMFKQNYASMVEQYILRAIVYGELLIANNIQ